MTATAATAEDLPALIEAVDSICARLAYATQNTSVATRTVLHLGKSTGPGHHQVR